MVRRIVNMGDSEPEQGNFKLPSEGEHGFQVVDVFTCNDETGEKMNLDENTVSVKCEVFTEGDNFGRTILQRCNIDEKWKGFFATRLFLKAIGEPHKGSGIEIDTDRWIGRQFYATVVHNKGTNDKTYANISEYNFDKVVDIGSVKPVDPASIAWNE